MAGVIGTQLIAQVGFIVKDVETTKRKWAEFLGVPVPETQPCGDYAVTQTVFEGKPAPEASSLLAFLDIGPGIQLELIQPNEAPSTWRKRGSGGPAAGAAREIRRRRRRVQLPGRAGPEMHHRTAGKLREMTPRGRQKNLPGIY